MFEGVSLYFAVFASYDGRNLRALGRDAQATPHAVLAVVRQAELERRLLVSLLLGGVSLSPALLWRLCLLQAAVLGQGSLQGPGLAQLPPQSQPFGAQTRSGALAFVPAKSASTPRGHSW